jgi:uncharacterized membrane protein
MKKLKYFWTKLNSTFWFIPSLLVIISVFLAFLFIYIDYEWKLEPNGLFKYIFAGSADSARSILSTIAGAMIGVAGTVFSITLVALTLASSQFGSRLLRNFMYDTLNQTVLGSFVATFVYCLIVLNSVRGAENFEFIPVLSVFAAIVFGILNIIMLIVFIHHIATSIHSDNIVSDITKNLINNLDNLLGDTDYENQIEHSPDMQFIKSQYKITKKIKSSKSGYIQLIDYNELLEYSTDNDILVIVNKRAGHFLVDSGSVFTIYSNKDLNEVNNLDSFFETGDMRTPHQDAEFAIHQIVEIATRALSPGINDPYTAITCIDNLSNIICKLTSIQYPYKNRYDDEGHLRLVIDTLDFEGMLDAAYNQIRQNAEANPTVLIRLLDALSCIMEFVQSSSQQKAVLKHIDMVMRIAEKKFTEKNDLTDLKIRYEKINIRYD